MVFAAIAMFVFASQAAAHTDPGHHEPGHPGSCWDITKVAKDSHGAVITELTLSLGQTYTIYYEIVVTERDCLAHETPHEAVNVTDSYAGILATHLDHSQTFTYTRDVTAHSCEAFDVDNTAEVSNSVVLDSATVSIHVTVACDQGCTLTQGYWKTHADPSNAKKFDTTWNLLPGGLGPNTTFFLSGTTWINVFNTPPAGNFYYQLAHQYMAAVLNKLNGASSTAAVDAAITSATNFFNTYTPAAGGCAGEVVFGAGERSRLGRHARLVQRGRDWPGSLRRVVVRTDRERRGPCESGGLAHCGACPDRGTPSISERSMRGGSERSRRRGREDAPKWPSYTSSGRQSPSLQMT